MHSHRKTIPLLLALFLSISAVVVHAQRAVDLKKKYNDYKSAYTILGDVKFSGVVRMTGYYKNMSEAYNDMATSNKNLSFSPYPVDISEAVNGANRGQPFMEFTLEGTPTEHGYFKVGYSFNHSFLGLGGDSTRQSGIRQFLKFEAGTKTKIGDIHLVAGGGSNWVSMSPLTLSQKEYRIEPFEKIPWDWYTNSPKKYTDYFDRQSLRTDERFGRAATQGFSVNMSNMPHNFGGLVFFGKTSRNLAPGFQDLPFYTFTTRVYNDLGKNTTLGGNYYLQRGNTDRVNGVVDARRIMTSDIRYSGKNMSFIGELGGGSIINPLTDNEWVWGESINLSAHFDKAITVIPVDIQFYDIDINVVSQEAAFFNSNLKAPSGGVTRTLEFDGNMYVNILQEVDMIANNRMGGKLRLSEQLGNFKIEVANAMSVEKENLYDTITIQHKVNAFTRSRFNPFGSSVGPYQRLRNRFMRSFETMVITDADSVKDYKKGFNAMDLVMKYKLKLGKHDLVIVNYNYGGSVGEGFKAIPGLSNSEFFRVFYEELSAYYSLNPKTVIMAFAGYERIVGNERTLLSPENGKPVDQTGTGFGVGLDWDFMRNGGLFIRHKWFNHEDVNFVLDKFAGQETSVEIKIFF